MRFAHPWALALAPAAWALAAAVARWGKTAALSYSTGESSKTRPPTPRARAARLAPSILTAAALTLAAAALARPQRVLAVAGEDGHGVDIVLAVDSSLSMNAMDFKPNRLAVAKELAKAFVRGRVSDRIGLVTFGGAPLLACPQTVDYAALGERIDDLEAGMTKADGTALGDGLASALRRLKESSAKSRVVVLLTDGRNNTGAVDPITAAKAAAALGVKVYAIGTAGRGSALMPIDDPRLGRTVVQIDDDLDEELLEEIARITGAKSYRAKDRSELADVFAEIDRLEKSPVRLPEIVAVADLHAWPLGAALLLLLAESTLAATVLLRWP